MTEQLDSREVFVPPSQETLDEFLNTALDAGATTLKPPLDYVPGQNYDYPNGPVTLLLWDTHDPIPDADGKSIRTQYSLKRGLEGLDIKKSTSTWPPSPPELPADNEDPYAQLRIWEERIVATEKAEAMEEDLGLNQVSEAEVRNLIDQIQTVQTAQRKSLKSGLGRILSITRR